MRQRDEQHGAAGRQSQVSSTAARGKSSPTPLPCLAVEGKAGSEGVGADLECSLDGWIDGWMDGWSEA